ncbi:MAG: sigma-70 family RNA polymerase sigma factor [Planctomycetota bacterium]
MSDETDALVQRIRQKDGEALAAYIRQYESRLCGFLRSISSDRLLAVVEVDDLLQEVSTAALSGLETAPLDEYSPMDWLQQIARRRVIDAHRFHFEAKRRDVGRQQSIHSSGNADSSSGGLEALLAASMTSPSAAVSRDLRLMRMQEAIGDLPDEQQAVIRMRYAEGLPTKKIAERVGKTDVAVRVLLSRSMKQLEKRLQDVKPTR